MRFIRSYAISGWLVLVLISAVGFAAFNARGSGAPTSTTVPEAPVVQGATARVGAFVLAEALTFKLDLPDPVDPPPLDVRMGPDARTSTRIRVGVTTTTSSTTTTTLPPTTTTQAPSTTRAPATTAAPTTTTAPPTTTTTAPPETTTTVATETTDEPATTTAAAVSAGVEQWRGLVSVYFGPEYVEQALSVMQCESRGDPSATNPYSGAAGLFQFMPRTWAWASAGAGFDGASPYDAEANVASAAWLAQDSLTNGGSAWSHWTCKP